MNTILNPKLVVKQDLSDRDVKELMRLHTLCERTFEQMEALDPKDPSENITLRVFGDLIESLEYNMQRVWKFDQDPQFHTWWYRVPYCTCPKMDNADPIYQWHILNSNCPVHGPH